MNILLIGATGMVGSRILTEATIRGHGVIAAVRTPERVAVVDHVSALALDVNDANAVIGQAQLADVIISAVSPRNSGDATKDAEAFTEALVEVQKATGKRIIMVGGAASLQMPDGTPVVNFMPDAILPEAQAMRHAYGKLVYADVDFTVIAPGGMIAPGDKIGEFRTGGRTILTNAEGQMSHISAEDFAIGVINEVENPAYFRTVCNVAY